MKNKAFVQNGKWAWLIGNGPVDDGDMSMLRSVPDLYCADGGANIALAHGGVPKGIYGDGDSINDAARKAFGNVVQVIRDEDTTDFEKCLGNIPETRILCFGFLGGRLDHQLAALSTLAKFPTKRAVIVGADEIALLVTSGLDIDLVEGADVALFPLTPSRLSSEGLVWETGGIEFDPVGMLGTSNKMAGRRLRFWDVSGAVVLILPRAALPAVQVGIEAIGDGAPKG